MKPGLDRRLIEFLQSNPDEELTFSDAAAKFGTKQRSVECAVSRLKQQGLVESVRVIRLPADIRWRAS